MQGEQSGAIWKAVGIAAALHVLAYAWFQWSSLGEVETPAGAPGLQVTFAAQPAPPAPAPEEEPAREEPEPPAEEEPVEEQVVEDLPPPPPQKPDVPLRAAEPPPQPQRLVRPAPAAPPASQGQAAAPSPSPAPYAGNAQTQATYIAELQAWLARHKRYPRAARRRGQEGDAVLRFVVDRAGEVRSSSIDRGTGHGLLDREVMEMLARAQPLPPVPADFGAETVEVVITVRFNLR